MHKIWSYTLSLSTGVAAGEEYSVTVITGNGPGSVSTARTYITLHGTRGSSNKTWLHGQSSVSLTCELGDLDNVTLGHDNTGPSPGWFVKQVPNDS